MKLDTIYWTEQVSHLFEEKPSDKYLPNLVRLCSESIWQDLTQQIYLMIINLKSDNLRVAKSDNYFLRVIQSQFPKWPFFEWIQKQENY